MPTDAASSIRANNDKCDQEIRAYLTIDKQPSIAKFVNKNYEFMKANTPTGVDVAQFWIARIRNMAKIMNITLKKGAKVSWKKLEATYKQQSNSSSPSSSAAATSKSSSASVLLSPSDKEKIDAIFEKLDDEKKWTLKSGTVVEDVMREFAKECDYLHPVHSLILNPYDDCWQARFTQNELHEIRSYKPLKLEPLPSEVQQYFDSYQGLCDLDSLTEKVMSQAAFHPKKQAEVYWAHKAVMEALDLFNYEWLPMDERTTEADVVRRVFPFIEKCFDESAFTIISGEKASISSSERKNAAQCITGTETVDRKDTGHKVDVIISYRDLEYGCAEAGLKGGSTSTKWINESDIKVSRLMKDMLWRMLKPNPTAINNVIVPGFVINGLNLMVEMMSIPKHYVCIVHKFGPMAFPDQIEAFYKQLVPLLTLTWQTKAVVKKTLKALSNDQTVFIPTPLTPTPPSVIPPCPPSPRVVSKGTKRKSPEEDDD
ncbi:hypothetical protein BDB00DRAFT_943432 [Zychaea mexicana]|uniref:uncharacterized protein n=1 Tax=Zychaea mexicana TaxID=64656 RepID=UPI0022FECE33|nr:uncharacterized protein BDB00DRAFT_943432 [Zychaea mexicana]KAI9479511.1 hypothetical protein BDB00DRAFT_943432 [Zychaea mexicana]